MTDQELLTSLQYGLVEPPDGGASWLSGLWTRDEVLHAVNTRQQQLLRDTQAIVTRVEIPVAPSTNPVTLPADWIASLAAVWRYTATGARSPVMTSDMFEADLMVPTWETVPATPLGFLDEDQGTLTARLAPIPDLAGTLELLYVALPTQATGANITLSIPDEILDGIKYGALADLLGKIGRGNDPVRSAYCQERFEQTELAVEILLGGWA